MHRLKPVLVAAGLAFFAGVACAASLPPIQPVAHVDLPRFMGTWYLIATVPTSYGKDAYNAVETYALKKDGNIHTTFTFHNDAFDGPVKHIESTGYVKDGTGNAVWGVALFWPFKLQYIVAYLKPDYS
ncbi:MAG TPA: lipocalin family protein, partial [Rhodanobacteraceae bacterium]